MSRKFNRRGFDRHDRFDDEDEVGGEFFGRKRRHDDEEEKLDDIIRLLKKILRELKEIEGDLDDNGNGNNNDNKHGHKKCKCHKKNDENCECDAVLIGFNANPATGERFGEILSVDSSGGNFGCNLTARMGSTAGASAAEAIACLKCKGFKVQSVEETNGPRQVVLLTRKRCDEKCDD